MHRTSLKRAAAGLTALAISGTSLVLMASPASADETVVAVADEQPTILNNAPGQAAGDLNLTITGETLDDNFIVEVDFNDGTNCLNANSAIGFSGTPTTNEGADLKITPQSSAGACTTLEVKDQLLIEVDGTLADAAIVLDNIKYNVAANVSKAQDGPVKVTVDGLSEVDDSNATIAVVDRISGDYDTNGQENRYDTAAKIADEAFDCAPTVIIASGVNFPDALAANYVAGWENAPILLVAQNALPSETSLAMKKLGTTKALVIGGSVAVSTGVVTAIGAQEIADCGTGADQANTTKIAVQRIEGTTRYTTAATLAGYKPADQIGTIDPTGNTCTLPAPRTVILASGENFPDALAAGGVSWAGSGSGACGNTNPIPILLTPKASLHEAAELFIKNNGIQNVWILGGTAAISQAVVDKVNAIDNVDITQFAGSTRMETATLLAAHLLGRDFDGSRAYIARGDAFPDALAGGSLAGKNASPILLSASSTALSGANNAFTATYLKNTDPPLQGATLFGGTVALNAAVQTSVGKAFTDRPA
jgi:putative cell wall-binding protein